MIVLHIVKVKVQVILLKYICTYINAGYDIVWETFLDVLILQEIFQHNPSQCRKIPKINFIK